MASRKSVLLTFVRGQRQYTKTWLPDATRYEKVKFHPRSPDHVDPPVVPSKVFMIHRVKPFGGNPYWEKNIMKEIGLKEDNKEPAFVKNTPEMCAKLWKIKHLIKIVPVQLPKDLPTVDDFTGTYIHENGKFYLTGKLDPARYEATMQFLNNPKRMESSTIQEKLRRLWLKGALI